MSDLRVPTIRQPVKITCIDGRAFDGYIFMPSQSARHDGPMRADEWSDSVQTFFPFRARDAVSSMIFNLHAVVAFTMPVDGADAATAHDDGEVLDAPVAWVSVDAGGTTFEGRVTIDTPPDRRRVADWFNAPGAFVLVRARDLHHLVHKRHITRVIEMPEAGN